MKEDLDDGRQTCIALCCDCKEEKKVYDMGGHFACKSCIIKSDNEQIIKDGGQKTLF